jgi:hypothetical protein
MLVYGFALLLVVILKVYTLLGLLFLSAGKVFALSFVKHQGKVKEKNL